MFTLIHDQLPYLQRKYLIKRNKEGLSLEIRNMVLKIQFGAGS